MKKSSCIFLDNLFVKSLQKTVCKNLENSRRSRKLSVENLTGNPYRSTPETGFSHWPHSPLGKSHLNLIL